jgi:hypothetical protein
MFRSDTDTRTGGNCAVAGIYRSDCPDHERTTLVVGDLFPKCPSCWKVVGWSLAVAS